MTRFVATRVVIAVCLLVALSLVTFVVYASIQVEPAGFLVDLQHAKPGQIAAAHHALGLDHSLFYRYGHYLEGLTHGDFGTAWSTLVIGYDGQMFERDLGPKTDELARAMASYDPDSAWKEVPETATASTTTP